MSDTDNETFKYLNSDTGKSESRLLKPGPWTRIKEGIFDTKALDSQRDTAQKYAENIKKPSPSSTIGDSAWAPPKAK